MTQDSIQKNVSKTTFKPEEHSYIHNDDAAEGTVWVFLQVSG